MAYRYYHRPVSLYNWSGAIKWLIIANVGIFIAQQLAGPEFVHLFGLVPRKVISNFRFWQFGTYLFLHGGIFHLLFNMFVLWMFGSSIEKSWGSKTFLKYYFLTGVGAGITNALFTPNSPIPIIGASGAIYGILVAFAMLFPKTTVYLYFIIPLTARQMVILFVVIEFLASLSASSSHIANLAHLGGMFTGYIYLKFGWGIKIYFKSMLRNAKNSKHRKRTESEKAVEKDLEDEVNRILEKILAEGPDSLTPSERKLMDRYSKS